ncbi:sensor histidine kinase [Actinocrispum wychmicini]|uniref:histidine kinase n=1 Tax=Actinocrispum wychmicini TaxID=1213861 RepID=A0A4R2JJV2_9PSEU|nr:sensor histidine kinase [Actinocrispum wychmicini]TCO57306.1 signal transduction histidine kinase [Actinocrispum wychmicini]
MLKQWGKSLGYLAVVGALTPVSMLLLFLLPMSAMSIVAAGLGFVLIPIVVMIIRLWTDLHRSLIGLVLDEPVPSAFRPPTGSIFRRLVQVATDSNTWRDIIWLVLNCFLGFGMAMLGLVLLVFATVGTFVALFWWTVRDGDSIQFMGSHVNNFGMALLLGAPLAIFSVIIAWYAIPFLAKTHALISKVLLSPSQLEARVEELTETRAGAVNAHEAELRRIERDLHDGTQARLVSIAMRLGVAEKSLPQDDPAGLLVREAREGAEQAMGELRDVIRTMYPPILADRGLANALAALGARCPVPVGVEVGELGRVPAAVETAAYYVVAEALTNVAKHSQATRASVRVTWDNALVIIVADNGFGGIDESRGTGVLGMRRRVAALDGTLTVDSPNGGPTVISVELPCAS